MAYDPDLSSPASRKPPERTKSGPGVSIANPSMSERTLKASDAQRVDEALNSVLNHRNAPYVEPRENLSALREEVNSLRYRATDNLRSRIRGNPWQAVGIAAFAGFVFGITR